MSLGVEKLLPSDCLYINEFRAIHMNTHSDAYGYSLLPKFQFPIEFACLAYLYLHKVAFN